ncbi:recombinase family protein [cf. Phormidesmis sp. LEGE 11477]|uniref:IS1096 element passenger TnpR family protein n=1 Tax=cf. Phormidesmis sp. LEGE 11477 TaxID=1828680 RepID=UPI001D14FEE7|nr:recombinase family protein [cf. Phormidesmis sp. LEGE 11477]
MVQKTVAIYCRVSTTDQSCERQSQDLLFYAKKAGFKVVGVWKETASGTKQNRVERQKVMELAQARKIDAILVTEMTRWGRSTLDLIQTLQELQNWDVSLIAQTGLQFDLATPQGKLIAQLMAALAEFERDLVSERVRSGLAAAKARGKVLGRQLGQRTKSDRLAPQVIQMVEDKVSYRTIAHDLKLSKTTVTEIVKRHRQAHPDFQPSKSKMAPRKKAQSVYQLKITLTGIRPPIWRRVLVRSDVTLSHLHWVIQLSMGWTNSHLHSFTIHGQEYGVPMPELGFAELEPEDERSVKLTSFIPAEKFKFSYLYDFGDSWEHEVLVEKVLTAETDLDYPVCIKAKRACPPEDCGGTWGYQEFVEAVQDTEHPEHEALLEWAGGYFDPEDAEFDEINPCLKMIPQDAANFEG